MWKRILWNRFVFVFGLLLLLGTGWNIYVALHNDGRITGRVVGPQGEPIADALVTINAFERNVVGPPTTTRTDVQGRFVFENMHLFHFIIKAEKEGWKPAIPETYHLWFRSQNFSLPHPLRLEVKK